MPYIPLDIIKECLQDPFYSFCAISGRTPVQFHEHFKFGHRQVKEKWAIVPLHHEIHALEKRKDLSEKLDWICLNRATDEELERHSKVTDLKKRRELLNKKYGEFKNR